MAHFYKKKHFYQFTLFLNRFPTRPFVLGYCPLASQYKKLFYKRWHQTKADIETHILKKHNLIWTNSRLRFVIQSQFNVRFQRQALASLRSCQYQNLATLAPRPTLAPPSAPATKATSKSHKRWNGPKKSSSILDSISTDLGRQG